MLDAAVVMRFRAGRTPLRVRAEATILGHGDAGRATARPKVLRIILGLQLAKLAAQNSVFVPKSERNFLLALCTLTLSALGRARRHAARRMRISIGMAIRRRGALLPGRAAAFEGSGFGSVPRTRGALWGAGDPIGDARRRRDASLAHADDALDETHDAPRDRSGSKGGSKSTRAITGDSGHAPSPLARQLCGLSPFSLSLSMYLTLSLSLSSSQTPRLGNSCARVAREPQSADTLSRHSWSCKLSHTRHAQIPP